jgi:hypothetical protein
VACRRNRYVRYTAEHSVRVSLPFSGRYTFVRCGQPLGSNPLCCKLGTAPYVGRGQPSGRRLIPHPIVHRKSVCQGSSVRSRAVGAYFRTDRRHTVELARVAQLDGKSSIPSSFTTTRSTKAATSRRGNSRSSSPPSHGRRDRPTFFAKEYMRDLTRARAVQRRPTNPPRTALNLSTGGLPLTTRL